METQSSEHWYNHKYYWTVSVQSTTDPTEIRDLHLCGADDLPTALRLIQEQMEDVSLTYNNVTLILKGGL